MHLSLCMCNIDKIVVIGVVFKNELEECHNRMSRFDTLIVVVLVSKYLFANFDSCLLNRDTMIIR